GPGPDDRAVAEHHRGLDAVGVGLGDDVVVALPHLVAALTAGHPAPRVLRPAEDGADVGTDRVLVPKHLQVPGADLAQPLAYPQLQPALADQWLGGLLGPHE